MVVVELKDISRHFMLGNNKVHALKNINLTINKGEFLVLKGASGSGKSTLLNIIGAMDEANSGNVSIANKCLNKLSDVKKSQIRKQHIGFIFQSFNLLPVLPLDGGHVLKSIAFSINSKIGLAVCVLGAVLGIYLSYHFGLALLGFLLAIGSIEIVFEYKRRHLSELLPLNRYAQVVSALWYILTLGGLSAIIWFVGQTANDALSLPLKILAS